MVFRSILRLSKIKFNLISLSAAYLRTAFGSLNCSTAPASVLASASRSIFRKRGPGVGEGAVESKIPRGNLFSFLLLFIMLRFRLRWLQVCLLLLPLWSPSTYVCCLHRSLSSGFSALLSRSVVSHQICIICFGNINIFSVHFELKLKRLSLCCA
jgi:hypothetical protein